MEFSLAQKMGGGRSRKGMREVNITNVVPRDGELQKMPKTGVFVDSQDEFHERNVAFWQHRGGVPLVVGKDGRIDTSGTEWFRRGIEASRGERGRG